MDALSDVALYVVVPAATGEPPTAANPAQLAPEQDSISNPVSSDELSVQVISIELEPVTVEVSAVGAVGVVASDPHVVHE